MRVLEKFAAVLLLLVSTVLPTACGGAESTDAQTDGAQPEVIEEKPASFEIDMLNLAFNAAMKMPLNPHIKNKSRAQDSIVQACLELGYPVRAKRYAGMIPNWRSALGMAGYAYYCADHGWKNEAMASVRAAEATVERMKKNSDEQAWRGDRILALVQATKDRLQRSGEKARDRHDPRRAALAAAAAAISSDDQFDDFRNSLPKTFKSEDFAAIEQQMHLCVEVFRSNYGNDLRRIAMERVVKTGYERLPLDKRINLILDLAEASLEHGDEERAGSLASEASARLNDAAWRPQQEIAMRAQIAGLKYRAGQIKNAQMDAKEAFDLYQKNRLNIVSIFRGEALRPLAEAHLVMNDRQRALELYEMALNEAVINPNARPRLIDLVAVCVSMATSRCEWSPAVKEKAEQVAGLLGDPW